MKWKDASDTVETVADEEGAYEEKYSPLRPQKFNLGSRLASVITRPGSMLGIGLLVLLAVLILVIRPGGSDRALLSEIEQRLQQLESRMAALEGISELVTDLDNNRQATQPLMVRLDRLETAFAKRLGEMEQQMTKLQAAPQKTGPTKPSPAPVAESRPPKQVAKTHVVKKGETLYSIGKQYGLSVAQLMALNKLSKGMVINPGQALKLQ